MATVTFDNITRRYPGTERRRRCHRPRQPAYAPRKGERIHLRIQPGEVHPFSATTGDRLPT